MDRRILRLAGEIRQVARMMQVRVVHAVRNHRIGDRQASANMGSSSIADSDGFDA